jgi:hypothetical protein
MNIHCKYDSLIKCNSLKPHPKNRNKHPEDQIERLAEILKYQGVRAPIVVSKRSGKIVKGHGTLQAIKQNGWEEAPVVYQDFEDDDQEWLFVQSDNAIAMWAELDLKGINADLSELGPFDIDLIGLKDFTVTPEEKDLGDEEATPEVRETDIQLGDLFQLGDHRLLCGDSTEKAQVEKLIKNQICEICFTSPPYSDQRNYNGNKELDTKHIAKFLTAAKENIKFFVVNLGYSRKNGEVNCYWNDYLEIAQNSSLKLLSWNIWDRSGFGYTVGQATAMFTIDHEWIFVFGENTKDLNRTIENKQAGLSKKGTIRQKDGNTTPVFTSTQTHRQLGTIIRCDVARYVGKEHKHPAMFPLELVESYLEALTNISDFVYDPFGGSGTTLIACEKTNRKCFMMELDPQYCQVIIDRWEQYTNKKAVKLV